MRAIDRIEEMAKSGDEPRVIEVPDLAKDGKKFLVYVWPLNLMEMDAIVKASDVGMDHAYAVTCQLRARDENRKPIFAEAEIERMVRVRGRGMAILKRLANEISSDMQGIVQASSGEELKELGED